MKKLLDVFKKPLWLLCLGLGIVLFASIFANMANTSLYSVQVTEVTFETEHGEMTGLIYRPRSCTAENPCATIVTTHGYLNTKEMQDAPAIELSRRGYVVFAIDQYAHGDSTWDANEYEGFAFSEWSQYDAVQYIYKKDFVLKAADGTGMIAVSGHSMGGFSSRLAAYKDSLDVAAGKDQKIVAMLAVGADFSLINAGVAAPDQYIQTREIIVADVANKRTVGTIAGQYDEFFFADFFRETVDITYMEGSGVTVKDWTTQDEGARFYYGDAAATVDTTDEITAGVWNTTSYGGGGSVIYTPNEIHPWNHFSVESTAYMIDFYDTAFETQLNLHKVTEYQGVVEYKDGTAQTWWLKEGFTFVALLGVFLAIIAAIALFAELPFFNKVKTAESEINAVAQPTGYRKWLMNGFLVLSCIATNYVFVRYALSIDTTTTHANAMNVYLQALQGVMWVCALVFIGTLVAGVVVKAIKGEDEKANKAITGTIVGAVVIFAAAFYAYWTMTRPFFANTKYFNQEKTTVIATWVLYAGALNLVSLAIGYFLNNKQDGYTCANYGLKANWKQILMALLIAVCVVGGVYVLTFVIEALLRVDFRVWTYAIKPFGWNHFVTFLRYLPVFFLFYLINSVVVVANTGHDKTWKGTLKAILINALPLVILLVLHYGKDFATGVAQWPTLALNMILVFALVPTMIFAAWITRKSYAKTGNIWTAVFINTLLFTMMQVANTILHVYSDLL